MQAPLINGKSYEESMCLSRNSGTLSDVLKIFCHFNNFIGVQTSLNCLVIGPVLVKIPVKLLKETLSVITLF